MSGSNRLYCIFLGIFIVASYLTGLGSYPFTESSEARYAGVSWEMLRSGDYLTPRYNGIKHLHKPPLFYWACASSMRLLGANELAARLPCACAALATLAVVAWWAARPEAGCSRPWLAPASLATSPFFWEMGRVVVTDMLLTFLIVLALAAAWKIMSDGPSPAPFILFWFSLGLSFLNKGPVAFLIVGIVLLPCFWKGKASWRSFSPLPGISLACAVALPWYLWIISANPGLLDYFLKFQTIDRIFTTVHHRTGPVWFYLPVLLGGFLPWSCWLPHCLRQAYRQAKKNEQPGPNLDLFLLFWLVVPTIFFSCMGSKLPPYVLPMFPAMALLVARHQSSLSAKARALAPITIAMISIACFILYHWLLPPRLLAFKPEVGLAAYWLAAVALCALVALIQKPETTFITTMTIAMLGAIAIAIPGLHKLERDSAEPLARIIRSHIDGPFEVAVYGGYLFGLPYYLDSFVTHVAHKREVQFEDNTDYQKRTFASLKAYLPTFQKEDKTRFLIVPLPALKSMHLNEPVIFADKNLAVLEHRRKTL